MRTLLLALLCAGNCIWTVESGELLSMMLNVLEDFGPCVVPCLLDKYSEFANAVETECMPKVKESIHDMMDAIPHSVVGPPTVFYIIDNPAPLCSVFDNITDCTSDLLSRFCGTGLKENFHTKILVPLRRSLDCEKKEESTLLRCLTHGYSVMPVQICAGALIADIHRATGNATNLEAVYNALLRDPSKQFCGISKDFVPCLGRELFEKNPSSCRQAVVNQIKNEASDIFNFFVCNTASSMDGLPCFGNPDVLETLEGDCFEPIKRQAQNIRTPKIGTVEFIGRLLAKHGPVGTFLNCTVETVSRSAVCKKDGWVQQQLHDVITPYVDFVTNEPEIGQCSCTFKGYTVGKCLTSAATLTPVQPWVVTLVAALLAWQARHPQ